MLKDLTPQHAEKSAKEVGCLAQQPAVDSLRARGAALAAEAARLSEAAEQAAPQAKIAEKAERTLRKLQQKFEELEAKRGRLEGELRGEQASAEASSGATQGSSRAEAEARQRNQALTQRVKELEAQLAKIQGPQHAGADAAKNRQQDEAIAAAEREHLALQQQLEERGRAVAKAREADAGIAAQLAKLQAANGRLGPRLRLLQAASAKLRDGQGQATAEARAAKQAFAEDMGRAIEAARRLGEEAGAMQANYSAAMDDRKKLHNQILDLKGNIRVFVRVRPMNAKEKPTEPTGEATVSFRDDTNIGLFDAQHSRRKWFEFDQVFDPNSSQASVFEEAKPLATSTLDGYNVCIFAYGQTGSGKTHTMTGTEKDPGLNTNVLRELFHIRDERKNEYDISISIAITEIYNETVRDLLCPTAKKLDVKINQDGSTGVPGLTELKVDTVGDVMKCIKEASKNRATTSTDMNEQSSRSHSIVTVRTQSTLRGGDTYIGKVHLIDLAGSENTNKSGVTGQSMKEAQNINKSLSALGDVIQSLVAKNPHTPYRNSKLTMMLKDSLGGDSKTLMIVCASPAQTNVTETSSSLNFASRARNVELGKAKRNAVAN
uniref:Kinesin-like protein n=1 Tax=Zooxanthella nutricula TaxID=1333877 RepID=A0A7S2L173_9DINO